MVLKRKIWWMSANPDRKKCVRIKIVSAWQGHFGQKCRHLAVGATCRRHVGDFISQALFLQPFSIACRKSYLEKRGSKCPPNAKSLACGLAFTRSFGFYAIARESMFMSHRKKQWHRHFLLSHRVDASYYHSIASDDARWAYFYVVLQRANNNKTFFIVSRASEQAMITWYREERASARRIAMSERFRTILLSFAREAMTRSIFYTSYHKKRRQRAYFLRNRMIEHVSHRKNETT